MQWLERFVVGGVIVSAFAVVGDVLRPKGFAGLFGAAPSVAIATLALTLLTEGKQYVAIEARSMIAGALAFLAYTVACVYLMAKRHLPASVTTVSMLFIWGIFAFGWWLLLLK